MSRSKGKTEERRPNAAFVKEAFVSGENPYAEAIRMARAIGGWECPAPGCGWMDLSSCFERWAGDPCPDCKTPIVAVTTNA